jgi:hypothetical protein
MRKTPRTCHMLQFRLEAVRLVKAGQCVASVAATA